MKNNPNIKYVLITIVASIWGLIIYKVIKGFGGNDTPLPKTMFKPIAAEDSLTTYTLLNIYYSDPFSNKIESEISYEGNSPEVLQRKSEYRNIPIENVEKNRLDRYSPPNPYNTYSPPIVPKPEEPAPLVKYNGYIYNPKTKKRIALINYNGKPMVVGIADKLDEKTKVIAIEYQQLTLSFNGKRFVIAAGG